METKDYPKPIIRSNDGEIICNWTLSAVKTTLIRPLWFHQAPKQGPFLLEKLVSSTLKRELISHQKEEILMYSQDYYAVWPHLTVYWKM